MKKPELTTAPQTEPTDEAARWRIPLWIHCLLLVLAAVAVGLGFLQEPGFGDDLTYWSFAFDLHEQGLKAWQIHSFHDLRWPVWGVCWLLQKVFGFGLASYYGVPIIYMTGGALLSFTFARKLTRSLATAWIAALAFLLHPLLDTVCYRPMPDLSEGVWGGAVMLAWWSTMRAQSRARTMLFAALTGTAIFILESNRITGSFIVPVVVLATAIYFRHRFGWLLAAGAVCLSLYCVEAYFYHQQFGDWLHDLHANMGNKGAKGTSAIALWQLPVRFFVVLWKGNPIAPVYSALAIIGLLGAAAGTRLLKLTKSGGENILPIASDEEPKLLGKILLLWLGVLYLEYSGVPQGFEGGWNPLIRDAVRFLCGLLVPLSVFTALGVATVLNACSSVPRFRRFHQKPVLRAALALVALLALIAATSREHFDLGYAPKMRHYMAGLPAQTKVFTHSDMRAIAFLIDSQKAESFQWQTPNSILLANETNEATAATCDQFWYAHKLVWLTSRKLLEKKKIPAKLQLASYFEEPQKNWRLTRLLTRDNTPDLVFQRRRKPSDPAPRIFSAAAPELASLIPALPAQWTKATGALNQISWQIPESFRGQYARIEIEATSEQVEAFALKLRFQKGNRVQADYLLKPYLQHLPSKSFFAFEIPADADQCLIQARIGKDVKAIKIDDFKLLLQAPPTDAPRAAGL